MIKQNLYDEVNKPNHYRSHESGIEAIEVTRYMQFDLGNCWKYCMRYQDKGTPKKDLLKAVWYIKDFTKYFIDYKNDCTYIHNMPENIITLMCKVADAEPNEIIKNIFNLIIMLTTQNEIIDRKNFDNSIYELEQYANNLA